MNNNPYLYDLTRHTMRETEQRAAERRLVASLRPSRHEPQAHVLARLLRRISAVGLSRPAVHTEPVVDASIRPTAP